MKKVLLLVAVCSALSFTACKTTEKAAQPSEPQVVYVEPAKPVCNYTVASAKQKEVSMGPEIVVRPLIADIQMGERFAYSCTIIRDDECGDNEIEVLKQQAMHKCMAERKIDFIISPEYLVKLNGGTATISITGRDAFYANVRTFEQEMKNAQSLSCDEMEHATQYMNFRKDPYNYKGCPKPEPSVIHDTVLVNPYCPCCHQKKENINDPVCKKCANGQCSSHNHDVVVSKDQVAVDKANGIDIPQMIENYDHFSIEINHSNAGSGIISLPVKKVEKAVSDRQKAPKAKKVKRTTKVEEETEE